MNLRRRIRTVFEVILAQVGLVCLPFCPRSGILWLARVLGSLAFVVARRERRITMANLDLAYGDGLPAAEKAAIGRQSFVSIALVVLDIFWFARWTRARIERHVRFEPSILEALQRGPRVFITGHLGNWEVMGQGAALRGYPLTSVAKPLSNPGIDRILNEIRRRTGQKIVAREGALRSMFQVLRNGGVVALLLDQDTRVRDGGVFVDFFKVPVPIASAPGAVALRMSLPITPAFCLPDREGNYLAYALPSLVPTADDTAEGITQKITTMLEEEIRRHPGAWLWMYKRWKRKAPGFPRERYPFYADC